MRYLVTGAGGFIGHNLAVHLRESGHEVIGVDLKENEFGVRDYELYKLDLRLTTSLELLTGILTMVDKPVDGIFHLAANMGGIGFISSNWASISRDNTLIDINMLDLAKTLSVPIVYSSSACVYPGYRQHESDSTMLSEDMAIPAEPEKGYGWEKLYAEQLFQYYREEYGLPTKVLRFHNIYGPLGTYKGGREKAPAAVCRKIASLPVDGGEVEVWGDGQATRSYCYIDDCVEGLVRMMNSDLQGPINLGSEESISVNSLYNLVADIAGKRITVKHDLTKPEGVRGRNSDNTLIKELMDWAPGTSLQDGMLQTYRWVSRQVAKDKK